MTKLSDIQRQFILHWGEMGTRWGVNRTVAQVHALLYLSPEPLTAEEISDFLSVARSNVSTSLKELQNWNLVQIESRMGDRRDYFRTSSDVWTWLFWNAVVRSSRNPTDKRTVRCLVRRNDLSRSVTRSSMARFSWFIPTYPEPGDEESANVACCLTDRA